MAQKITFVCDACETKGLIKLGDDFDDVEIAFCPACGDPMDLGADDSDEE